MEMNDLELVSIKEVCITKVNGFESSSLLDILSVEEPLEIRISYGSETEKTHKNISVTMRTPGNDFDLAIGFLFTEGIIISYQDVKKIYHIQTDCSFQKKNIVQVDLADNFIPHLMSSDRNFYTTSSCGVCGKNSIQSIKTVSSFNPLENPKLNIAAEVFYQLQNKLKAAQSSFAVTGGIHASGLFTIEGDLVLLQEDVGRHNALDKLIGTALANNLLPLNKHILLLSGRASFELIQKAAMAGISVVAAIGAPSSLAVELAKEFNITLLGFLKDDRFNIYNSSDIR
ncbi:formate dehydrogenase accessory sulfurtransferase FdhD [Flavobacterium soyae]|uniref:formate dehydrogenase accessory sulfurtransferase FdhD n=1 Tax=Flavobacterium soyae TaxID=2903098 RepID=UPI001E5CCF9C|nr:formate dehydrogenase accessory sulfurtransferase FdhD [Flavobacterium soyae]MCD9574183.1 formate dehydrogenase accessory sulfurtransferase FdhD [Flavobacterium soyae]